MVSPARNRITYNAIRAAILKEENVEYWALRMYDQLDAGILYDYQVEELEVLIDEYYKRHEEPVETQENDTEVM